MKILLASHNKGKINEFVNLLSDLNIEFCLLDEFEKVEEPLEYGKTLVENALIKAKYYYDLFKLPVIADDTGLFIKGLNNEPGVHSARYSGNGEDGNRKKVLENLKSNDRSAYFETVLVYFDGKTLISSNGRLFGEIAYKEIGNMGFGYDSIFYLPSYQKTLAEIGPIEKNKISHRHNAILEMSFKLKFLLNEITHHDYIEKLIIDVYQTSAQSIERLPGGMSNDTYLVNLGDKKKVVRIPGFSDNVYVDRFNEYESLKIVKGHNLFVQFDYFDEITGVKISPYIEEKHEELDYKKLSYTLEELHKNVKLDKTYDPIKQLAYYYRLNQIFEEKLDPLFNELYQKIKSYAPYLNKRPVVACHNDNQLSNFILNKDAYRLIDFEFTGNNDPLFDYACFGNNDLSIGKKAYSITVGRDITEEENKVIELWYSVQAMTWYLVASFKDATGLGESLGLDFKEIATMFLRKAENLLKKY